MTEDPANLSGDELRQAVEEAWREEAAAEEAERDQGPGGPLRPSEPITSVPLVEAERAAERTATARRRREALEAEQRRRAEAGG